MASNPPAFSLPIRAFPSSNSSDDESGGPLEKRKRSSGRSSSGSSSSSSSSESESFHSGAEEEFETASERPFAGDPDEEVLEVAGSEADGAVPMVDSEVGFPPAERGMPIAHVSGGDDGDSKGIGDDGFLGDVDGDDGVSGVARVPFGESSQGGWVSGIGEEAALEGNLEGRVLLEAGASAGNGSEVKKDAFVIQGESTTVEDRPVVEKENSAVGGDSAVGVERFDSKAFETLDSAVGEPEDAKAIGMDAGVAEGDEAAVDNDGADKSFESLASVSSTAKKLESGYGRKPGIEELGKSDETGVRSDRGSAVAKELEGLKAVEVDVGVVGNGGSDKSSESITESVAASIAGGFKSIAATFSGMLESHSRDKLPMRKSEKAHEAGVEESESSKSVEADIVVEDENKAGGNNALEKQLGFVTGNVDATSQSGSQSRPASTDSIEKSDVIDSGSDQLGHVIEEELATLNADGAEARIGDDVSDKNLELITPAVVETPQSNSQDKAGLKESEPASTDSVVKSKETGSESDQGHVIEDELASLNTVGAETSVTQKNEDTGDGDSDKSVKSITSVVIEVPQSYSHDKDGVEESEPASTDSAAEYKETGSGSQAGRASEEELADLNSVGAQICAAEKKEAVGDADSDKNIETGSASDQVSSVIEETTDSKSVVREKNEVDVSPVDLGAPNELVPVSREKDYGRYEMQTANSVDNELIEPTLEKETQPLVVENSNGPEMDKEVLGSSGETSIVDAGVNDKNDMLEDGILNDTHIPECQISAENLLLGSVSADTEVKREIEDSGVEGDEEEDDMGGSGTVERIIREIGQGSSSSQLGLESSGDRLQKIDGQVVSDSDEEVETDEEGDGKELFDSAALAALLKAASGAAPDGSITISAPDGSRFFSVERPAGLGSSVPSLRPAAPRPNRPNVFTPSDLAIVGESENSMDEEEKKLHEKIQQIRVKFLRLVQRLGHASEDTVAQQVLYRLDLAEGLRRGRQTNRFSRESARKTAMQLEEAGNDDLNFSCNILILGKIGVGKSATINSIFGEVKTPISAFEPATCCVKEIVGIVDGVKIRVIDTPGLRASVMDQNSNRKILYSVKKFMKKCPPDIVLYIDRLDTQTRDFNDLPLLRSISSVLGPSIWLNAIVALTHAASAPPDGPNGVPLSYEVFVAQRSHIVQHSIRQAAGDMRLMNPVALVENHPSCRRNREGERILPNGQNWRPQLLLLCYSSKILSEANSLLKLQDPSAGKLFGFRIRSPPLPFLLSSLLQSRAHPKLSPDMGGENVDSDIDLDDLSDSDREEEEDEYDQLPPFKPLRRAQIAKLSKEQKKAYFDEYDYRVKLLQKKQWREELRRLRESKKRGKEGRDDLGYGDMGEDYDQENGSPAAVPVPLPDMVLPPSFDGDNPAYRYRFLEPTSQLLARPVLDTHGWDHDCGYDGVSLEESLTVVSRFPAAVSVQITKDKKEFNIHLDSSISAKHGENGSTMTGFDIQSVGKQLAYIFRGETKFRNLKKNKTTAGASITFLGENVATGLKIEDQLSIGKRLNLVASTGAIRSQGDMAYGANLEARLREKDFPIGQDQSTLGLSLMRWRGDLALGANLQSQFSIGRNSKMAVRVGLNNKLSGQITVRTSSSEQLQIALVGIIPIAAAVMRNIWPGESYIMH